MSKKSDQQGNVINKLYQEIDALQQNLVKAHIANRVLPSNPLVNRIMSTQYMGNIFDSDGQMLYTRMDVTDEGLQGLSLDVGPTIQEYLDNHVFDQINEYKRQSGNCMPLNDSLSNMFLDIYRGRGYEEGLCTHIFHIETGHRSPLLGFKKKTREATLKMYTDS